MATNIVDRVKLAKKDKLVGITINNNANLFSNGITQNAYFIYQCLEKMGFKCQFLCVEANPSKFAHRDLPLKQISTNPLEFDPSEYNAVITVSCGLTNEEYLFLKKHNVYVVAFVCGNQIMHHMEDFVRGTRTPGLSTYVGKTSVVDEVWTIPSYTHSIEYISLIRGKPTFAVPHLWSPTIMAESTVRLFKKTEDDLLYNYAAHCGKKINILILEPNVALFKNSWLPIVASEKLNIDNGEIIDNVYAFNFPEHNNAYSMTDNLTVKNKLRYFKRLSMPEIMIHFNEKGSFPVIVSHQMLNSLNYLYYEALYYGWPLVHNSPDLDGCGYYYPENDIGQCVAEIMKAFTTHNRNIDAYIEKSRAYLKHIDPLSEEMGKTWNGLLCAGIAKNISEC